MVTPKKKTTLRKPAAGTGKPRSKTPQKSKAAGPREEAIANDALKLVDQAAGLLRRAIRSGAETSQTTRLEARHQAHDLLTKASSALGRVLNQSTSTLHNVINKI
ncbi:MAG TPA: hypothetical protein VIS99_15390 [Terrimicrobiaceae bacterium]